VEVRLLNFHSGAVFGRAIDAVCEMQYCGGLALYLEVYVRNGTYFGYIFLFQKFYFF
jgi:hypothetical protein